MPSTRRAPRATLPPRRLLAALVLAIAACGGASAKSEPATPAPVPLAALAGQRVILLPAPTVDLSRDSAPAGTPALDRRATLAALDSAIERALTSRARTVTWVTVAQVARTSRRNASIAPDPYALSSESLRRPLRMENSLVEPLSSQLRSLSALNDARLILYPIDLRLERTAGTGRATVRVALLDSRLSRVMWIGDVRGESVDTSLAPLLASVASKLADLFAAQ